ncbi:glutathione S-transferase [Poseidonocella pacifica]|uniref:Glutathione S-transferase n=1 Tax=Poseidonocella pacifica TaxID=871651 RepID=A0A1I0YYA9_9RHOB|nr:glutathione S-transferase [Poseidonocella pacifica]SFB18365.1 glutathione S-transferase [Poseidonocella pacifica]
MSYLLALGDRSYSSWSLRAWLLFEKFNLPVTCVFGRLYEPGFADMLGQFPPARTVPALALHGHVIWDTLAIAEELASRHPNVRIWPKDPNARAIARTLAAEMHSGFSALRNHCPMNLRLAYSDCAPTEEVMADLARIEALWAWARAETGATGPWLCGEYSAADAFYAPVAARIAGHSLKVGPDAQAYVTAHLTDPAFMEWRDAGLSDAPQTHYAREWPTKEWPV